MNIFIIGRGNSGTRVLSHLLSKNCFRTGEVNESGDYMGTTGRRGRHLLDMFEACRLLGKEVKYEGGCKWDFSGLFSGKIDEEFKLALMEYVHPIMKCEMSDNFIKLPELLLTLPWLTRLLPNAYYIYLIRDPRDSIITAHRGTDNIREYNIDCGSMHIDRKSEDMNVLRFSRAVSWQYQYEIAQCTPKPEKWIEFRFEDLILDTDNQLQRLTDFLGREVRTNGYELRRSPVGRWKTDEHVHYFDFFEEPMKRYGYGE